MANRRRTQINKAVLKPRDAMLCGIHLGGCKKRLKPNEISLDHIIPQSFCAEQPEQRLANLQIMCKRCNNVKKAGQLSDLPVFNCTCHYFQIEDANLVLVYEDMRPEFRKYNTKHVIFEGIIDHPERIRASWQDDRRTFKPNTASHVELLGENSEVVGKSWIISGQQRVRIDGRVRDVTGWSSDPKMQFGHRIPCMSYEHVGPFNVEQRNHGPFMQIGDVRFYLPEFRGRAYESLDLNELPENSNLFDFTLLPSAEIDEIVNGRRSKA